MNLIVVTYSLVPQLCREVCFVIVSTAACPFLSVWFLNTYHNNKVANPYYLHLLHTSGLDGQDGDEISQHLTICVTTSE